MTALSNGILRQPDILCGETDSDARHWNALASLHQPVFRASRREAGDRPVCRLPGRQGGDTLTIGPGERILEESALVPQDLESEHKAARREVDPGASQAPSQEEVETTQVRPPAATREDSSVHAPEPEGTGPILGVVITYSDTHELDQRELDPRLGCVYPLREGEILFVGRHPAPEEVLRRDGESVPPTHCHLFPHGGLYGYISRRHLTVEMDPLGGTILTDYSRYGIYLENAGKWHRRKDPAGPPESHRVTGEETVILMDDLGEPTSRDLAERRSHYRFHVLRSTRVASRDPMTETRP